MAFPFQFIFTTFLSELLTILRWVQCNALLWISYWYVYASFAPFWHIVVCDGECYVVETFIFTVPMIMWPILIYNLHAFAILLYIFISTSGTPSQTIACWPNLNVWRQITLCDRDRLSRAVRETCQFSAKKCMISSVDPRQTIACYRQIILKWIYWNRFRLFSHIVSRRGVMSEIYPYWRRLLHTSSSLVYTSFYITVVFRAKMRYFRIQRRHCYTKR
jgi:hypothetical protein